MGKDPWDALVDLFVGEVEGDLSPTAADNVLIAWPPILQFIEANVGAGSSVLDFGCGGGQFANELHSRGYVVTAVDRSPAMIERARAAFGSTVKFQRGGIEALDFEGQFDCVTSIMTLDFIEDVAGALLALSRRLMTGGVMAIAVHNPRYVRNWIATGHTYVGFDAASEPKRGFLDFGSGQTVAMYLRSANEYNALTKANGMEQVLQVAPPFTDEFLRLYPQDGPTNDSEYLILGYRRGASSGAI